MGFGNTDQFPAHPLKNDPGQGKRKEKNGDMGGTEFKVSGSVGALNSHTAGCTQLNIGEGISKFLFRKNADTAESVPDYFLLSTQFFTDFTFRLINVRAQGGIHFFFSLMEMLNIYFILQKLHT